MDDSTYVPTGMMLALSVLTPVLQRSCSTGPSSKFIFEVDFDEGAREYCCHEDDTDDVCALTLFGGRKDGCL